MEPRYKDRLVLLGLLVQQAVAYLNFGGQCVEAFRFYAEALDGRVESVLTFNDAPPCERSPMAQTSRVRHAVMHLEGLTLMGCDGLTDQANANNYRFALTINVPCCQRAMNAFMALAEEGFVVRAFQSMGTSMGFGTVIDQFGMLWTVVSSTPRCQGECIGGAMHEPNSPVAG